MSSNNVAQEIGPIAPEEPVFGCSPRSWVVVSKATGRAVLETFNVEIVGAINSNNYYVFTARDYLGQVNQQIKLGNPLYFSKPYKDTMKSTA